MAIKGGSLSHRHQTTMEYILDRASEPGVVCVASGVAGKVDIMGGSASGVGASGVYPVGILLNTREEFNYAKEAERFSYDTDDIGTVVTLLHDGVLVIDQVVENAGVAITPGQPAYLAPNGQVGNANLGTGEAQRVGQFMSAVDSDGFVRLRVEIQ